MFKVGMYVRCPVDDETDNISDSRTFLLGQIKEINEETQVAIVRFHDHRNLRNFFTDLPEEDTFLLKYLKRATALPESYVVFKEKRIKILSVIPDSGKNGEFFNYFVEYFKDSKAQIGKVGEFQIEIPFTRINFNPVYQMLGYELHNPRWYLRRRIVSESLNLIRNSPNGFENLLGTRVQLFTHQVDTIIRALSETPCRLMLADEVGLGKTIEAASIMKGMKDKKVNLKTLIVLPETLVYQWQTELSFKFWVDAPIWGVDNYKNESALIVSTSDLANNYSEIIGLADWDLSIIDEAHKLLNQDTLYKAVLEVSLKTENILLLSATPILYRGQEYKKLLTLLNPSRFMDMPNEEFGGLLEKQKIIRDIIFDLMRDLPDYSEYGMYQDFVDGFNEINEEIADEKFAELINDIDEEADDKGLFGVKLCLAYISEFYQIERGIIRHRRAEIDLANIKRELVELPYEMGASDVGFYEENFYYAILDYIEDLISKNTDTAKTKELLARISSSPFAVEEFFHNNKEFDLPDNVKQYLNNWKENTDNEIRNIKKVSDDIDSFYSKFAKAIDYIDQEDVSNKKKFLIFTSFTSTAQELEKCFKRFFGEDTVCAFHREMTLAEMQDSATVFQNKEEYRFMICDESGGEGRNFQVADYIIHFDLPWSPALLEQRIGRLDRIGRDIDKKVFSVVLYANETIENDLFNIYNNGLNIFNASLCGMEIAFEQIHETIQNALNDDIRFGLSKILDEIIKFSNIMENEVERERYFDLARQLDLNLQEKLNELIHHFTDNDGERLMDTMMAWPQMAGYAGISISDPFKDSSKVVSIDTTDLNARSMMKSMYFPPRMDEIVKKSKYRNDIRGTFSRTAAVKHENLTFLAPFNPLFDSIIANAEECYKGRCVAMQIDKSDIEWSGLLTTWNIRFNPSKIYKMGLSNDLIMYVSRHLSNKQINCAHPTNSNYAGVSVEEILEQIDLKQSKNPIHLGKRGNNSIEKFKRAFPIDKWTGYVKRSYNQGKAETVEQSKYISNFTQARRELEQVLAANKAREAYYGYSNEVLSIRTTEEIDAIIYGLENPIIELDSISFIILRKAKEVTNE